MLSQHDEATLQKVNKSYLKWCETGDHGEIEQCADLLVAADDPQAVWTEALGFSEKLTGKRCPDSCRDITQTVRIKNRAKRLN